MLPPKQVQKLSRNVVVVDSSSGILKQTCRIDFFLIPKSIFSFNATNTINFILFPFFFSRISSAFGKIIILTTFEGTTLKSSLFLVLTQCIPSSFINMEVNLPRDGCIMDNSNGGINNSSILISSSFCSSLVLLFSNNNSADNSSAFGREDVARNKNDAVSFVLVLNRSFNRNAARSSGLQSSKFGNDGLLLDIIVVLLPRIFFLLFVLFICLFNQYYYH
mmetsp:Transcript_5627/g.6527  ORF Transcript_5627/g.6527 Transcript_5627/m.6527 type:complete len:220 (-) Transcript_5627:97-756(-)